MFKVLAVLHSTLLLQWEGENFIGRGWRWCRVMGLLWRAWRRFQQSEGNRQCHLHPWPFWLVPAVRQHQLTVTEALTTKAPGFFSSQLPGTAWRTCIHPGSLPSQEPVCWCKLPLGLSSGSMEKSKFSLCFPLEPELERLSPLIFSWCV